MLLAVLFWFGRRQPRRRALWLAFGLPCLTLVVAGIGPTIQVFGRVDDGYNVLEWSKSFFSDVMQ
jgi:hypothetical protein